MYIYIYMYIYNTLKYAQVPLGKILEPQQGV